MHDFLKLPFHVTQNCVVNFGILFHYMKKPINRGCYTFSSPFSIFKEWGELELWSDHFLNIEKFFPLSLEVKIRDYHTFSNNEISTKNEKVLSEKNQ